MQRTLYLNENRNITVRLDGPSLWIKEKEKAGKRVPFRLITQVIITGNIRLETGAIMALAEKGVPVTFISRDGKNRVTALAIEPSENSLRERAVRLWKDDKGRVRVENRLNASRHNTRLKTLKIFMPERSNHFETCGFDNRDYERIFTYLLSEDTDAYAEKAVRRIIEGLFHEAVLTSIMDAGLDPHTGFIHRNMDFGFVKDICFAIEGQIDRQVLQFFRRRDWDGFLVRINRERQINSAGINNLVVRFENQKGKLLKELDQLICDFFGILREFH